jgi:AcrR family transcriptional regulator
MSSSSVVRKRKVVVAKVAAAKPVAAPRRTQAERSESMQLRLVQAAAVELRRKGYAGLRTDEVARAAKVSRGALHHHFPNKDGLVVATAAYLLDSGLQRGTARADAARLAGDPIEAIIQDSMDFFLGADFSVILDLVIASGKSNALRKQVYKSARSSRVSVEDAWTEVLQSHGLPADKANKIVWITISIVRGFAVRALWQKDEQLFRAVLAEWKTILAGHLKTLPGNSL